MLEIRKTTHSVNPWRIGHVGNAGVWRQVPYATFSRKRDALAAKIALEAVADWTGPTQPMSAEQLEAVWRILRSTPGYEIHEAAQMAHERNSQRF
jgi:hypothetical protein